MSVDQDARLAFGTIEPLNTLKARLQEPDTFDASGRSAVDFNQLIHKIDGLISDLQTLTAATTGESNDATQQEMEAESQKRSAGQAERQKRLAPCNTKPSTTSSNQMPSPHVQNQRPPVSRMPVPTQ